MSLSLRKNTFFSFFFFLYTKFWFQLQWPLICKCQFLIEVLYEECIVSSMCKYRVTFTSLDSIALFFFTAFSWFSIRHLMMWRGITVIHEFILVSLHLEAIISTQHLITVHVLLKCSWLSCLSCLSTQTATELQPLTTQSIYYCFLYKTGMCGNVFENCIYAST